ncbi:MAG: aminotransferase class I/II-fold pyridoxal phosphate-dependent enzyme, partial [candidate division Zixibacteria bacterium]|nr:aminotransferase class I/II-fold pyridoxal phosphate-dependent enzyme [candidate division Zixibacteria bacterium]
MRFAERMKNLGTETAFEVLAKAKALEAKGKEVIHLEIGEPDFDTPKNIKEAAIKALNEGYTHYTPSAGLMEAREAVAKYVSQTRGIEVNPEEVVITPGGKPVMFFAILALIDPGDEIIYPIPAYPIYESVVNFVGGKPVPIHLKEENDFRLDTDELKAAVTPRTKMVIINSPHNPTGGILTKEDLEAIADLAQVHNLWILSDEMYSRIIYSGNHLSIASLPGM